MSRSSPEPTLVFSVDYHDGRDGKKGWPIVAWMWVAPRVGDLMDVEVLSCDSEGIGHRCLKRCKVVSVVLYSYGSEGMREYAGELMLAALP